ncbi:PTS system subunit IIABC [Escherichia coli]|nr:PTS system subunit IIABC [Escherichia coli]
MGVLLAYMFFGRGSAKQSAGGAAIIHFLGGIHEIYFPYVLMNPRLILAVILGGMTGVFTLTILGRWSGFSGISGFYPCCTGDDTKRCLFR